MSAEQCQASRDTLPDSRDGLTHADRIVLYVLRYTQQECQNRNVPTAMLYGRVLEHVQMSETELYQALNRLGVQGNVR
ncbi:hypothetical protein [Saccharospirillum impatiens]|uniref:hypothetical protein n=1 Tax=Saccharospirillum impatiens TaxID=169438 RepID=UPI000422F314|nr:hypothetical protein [Saccharospirillum impatiens]